jgi:hypothetical protein
MGSIETRASSLHTSLPLRAEPGHGVGDVEAAEAELGQACDEELVKLGRSKQGG